MLAHTVLHEILAYNIYRHSPSVYNVAFTNDAVLNTTEIKAWLGV